MKRSQSRQGFLVSAIVHMLILMALSSKIASIVAPEKTPEPALDPARRRVFLPPQSLLRQLAQTERPQPHPVSTPPPPNPKDRISIGAPSQPAERLILRPDQEVNAPKGRPDSQPSAAATPMPAATPMSARAGSPDTAESPVAGLKLPNGPGTMARGREAAQRGADGRSIVASLREFDTQLQHSDPPGVFTGTGPQTGALHFDPQGADFTKWIDQWRREVYRNWTMPQPFFMGIKGQVEIEFTVERDGRVSRVQIIHSSGVPAFDRAAQNSLTSSRFMSLPSDFQPTSVTMTVTFLYNTPPQGA